MSEIKFLGEFSGFMFKVDDKVWEVNMNAVGYLVLMEPDILVGQYPLWEDFEKAHPEFAATMVEVVKRKMNETIDFINRAQSQQAMPEVMPVPTLERRDEDCMYHRAYQ